MKNKTLFRVGALLLALLVPLVGLYGQATLTQTTLSAAVTSTSVDTLTVASATGFTAKTTFMYVDREYMSVIAVNGTLIQVIRGYAGTRATTHSSGATVSVGPANYFTNTYRAGSCTSTNELVLPIIDIISGLQYNCVGSVWTITSLPTAITNTAGQATGSGTTMFGFSDTAGNTGTGYVVAVTTGAGSAAKGLQVACGAQNSSATPANGTACYSLSTGTGGASTAAGTAGGNGGTSTVTTGGGGAGASTGTAGNGGELDITTGAGGAAAGAGATGGTGGLLKLLAGNGGGTVTGGAGGAVTITAGNGANGSAAGGSGGNISFRAGNVGTGGTGVAGLIRMLDAADATKIVTFDLSGLTASTTVKIIPPNLATTVPIIPVMNHSATAVNANTLHIVRDTCAIGSTCAVTLTGAAVFADTNYVCNAQDVTAAAATKVAISSGSAFTVTGTGTDTVIYTCIGN